MEEAVRRFARRILLIHFLLLLVVIAIVALVARGIYLNAREQAKLQAQARQVLLATQTARGIEAFYDSIQNDLDFLGTAESEESDATTNPTSGPVEPPPTDSPERSRGGGGGGILGLGGPRRNDGPGPGAGRSEGPVGQIVNAARIARPGNGPMGQRGPMIGPILWNQLKGRISHLFSLDRETFQIGTMGIRENATEVTAIVDQMRDWLSKVTRPSISGYQSFGAARGNLVCVPVRRNSRRMLCAVVPTSEINERFIRKLNEDQNTGAFLIDDSMIALAASSPEMVGLSLNKLDDEQVRQIAYDHVKNSRPDTLELTESHKLGSVALWPSLVTTEPVSIVGKKWLLIVASPLADVDRVVSLVFRNALLGAIFLVVSVTAILVSTAVKMIANRARLERIRIEILQQELEQARKIQLAWLPDDKDHGLKQLDVAACNHPASHISGDFYNWFELPDGRISVIIGDVTGHGMQAAFLMATTQLLVRSIMLRVGDASRCLEELNKQLCLQAFNGQFVTMLVMIFDLDRSEVEVATAGHPAPLISSNGSFQEVPLEPQLLLGVENNEAYPSQRLHFSPDSSFVLYTDGVIDCLAPKGSRFRLRGLVEALEHLHPPDANSILKKIIETVDDFRGPRQLADDLTLVTVKLSRRA